MYGPGPSDLSPLQTYPIRICIVTRSSQDPWACSLFRSTGQVTDLTSNIGWVSIFTHFGEFELTCCAVCKPEALYWNENRDCSGGIAVWFRKAKAPAIFPAKLRGNHIKIVDLASCQYYHTSFSFFLFSLFVHTCV